MSRLIRFSLVLAFSATALACGGGSKPYVPVDSPLRPWEAPEMPEEEPAGEPAPDGVPAPAPAAPTPPGK